MHKCTHCQQSFVRKSGSSGKFCSKSCAATYNNTGRIRSLESRQKTSVKMKEIRKGKGKNWKIWCDLSQKSCVICATTFFTATYNPRKTCKSIACIAAISVNKTSRCGSTNSIYWNHPEQGVLRFDSSWERLIAEALDRLNIRWYRPTIGIPWIDAHGKQRHYFPDFYLPTYNLYLDPKNDKVIKKDQQKLLSASKVINLVYGHPTMTINHITNLLSCATLP